MAKTQVTLGDLRSLTSHLPDSTPIEYKCPNFPGIVDDHQRLDHDDIRVDHVPGLGIVVLINVPFIDSVEDGE